jgi:hypothetical protein
MVHVGIRDNRSVELKGVAPNDFAAWEDEYYLWIE